MLSKNEKLMVIVTSLYTFTNAMSAVFMNVYLYAYTGSLVVMSIYTICRIGLYPLMFTLAGKIARFKSYSFTLMVGLVGLMGMLMFVLGVNQHFESYNWLVYIVAVLLGLSEGFFWLSVNTLNQVVTTLQTRVHYISSVGIFNNVANLIAPLIASFIIDYAPSDIDGYVNIFKVVLVLYFIIVIVAFKIKTDKGGNFTLLKVLWSKDDKQWRYCQISTFLYGIRDSLILTLAGILVYDATGGSGSLYGQLLAVFALASIIAFRVVAKKMVRTNRMKFYKTGAFLIASSTIFLVLFPNIYGAIYYGLVNAISTPMYSNPYQIIVMNAIQDYSAQENVAGRVIAKETALSIGRCFGMICIVISYFILPDKTYLLVSVLFTSMFPIILYFYANNYHKKRDMLKSNNTLVR